MELIQKALTSPVEAIHGGTAPVYRFIVSTDQEDRDGDIIKQDGWDFEQFEKNPIALLQHKHDQPVGKWTNIHQRVIDGVSQTVADLKLAPPVSDLLKYATALVEEGIMNATSVGFLAKNAEKRKDATGKPRRGLIIKNAILHEISLVSVPANPNAIRIAKSMHVSDDIVKQLVSSEVGNSASDFETDPDRSVLQRAKALLSQKASSDGKPEHSPVANRSIWNHATNPQLLEAMKKAKSVLK